MVKLEDFRERMKKSNATQVQMAEAAGVAQATIGRIIRGEVDPAYSTMEKLATYLDKIEKQNKRKVKK